MNLEKRSLIVVFNTKTTMKAQLETLKKNFKEMVSRVTKVRKLKFQRKSEIETFWSEIIEY